ncbi:D-sedoheptulose-7-phosphate isomerase [Lihuaxuella thermophila]|uniref:D-sedoheptulose 7-phosphate isomerase n=1 Tax=Lihuaxuella thermophila TaxID=1173111 RepID=A0A1H8G9M0_9BACL|nr:SIS domain-containing protein [Lihuaxuella thermophila]SEN40539.1 D-sedoheptulose 7-phosphate isomerase [Lihuaxuella thermophila]
MNEILEKLFSDHEDLRLCEKEIKQAYQLLVDCYRQNGKVLICGNGGSASDSEHMVGELMKDFMIRRSLAPEMKKRLADQFGDDGVYLAERLQGALPAISLVNQTALQTAIANDIAADLVFAQQVWGYGQPQDVLIGISTSGRSKNVIHAMQVARAKGLKTIGLTGGSGGRMHECCDVVICVPKHSVPEIQEKHLPIYHALCTMLEKEFFARDSASRI